MRDKTRIEIDPIDRVEFALSAIKQPPRSRRERSVLGAAIGPAISAARYIGRGATRPLRSVSDSPPRLPHPREIDNRLESTRVFAAPTLFGNTPPGLAYGIVNGMTLGVYEKLYRKDRDPSKAIRPTEIAVGALVHEVRDRKRARLFSAAMASRINAVNRSTGFEVDANVLGDPIVAKPGRTVEALTNVAMEIEDFRGPKPPEVVVLLTSNEDARDTLGIDPAIGHVDFINTHELLKEAGAKNDIWPRVPGG